MLDLDLKFDKKTDTSDNIIKYINFNFIKSKIDCKLTRRYIFILIRFVISHLSKL